MEGVLWWSVRAVDICNGLQRVGGLCKGSERGRGIGGGCSRNRGLGFEGG